ncbi:MAG: hypothetical protein FJY76_04275 [Candidatus Aenigmarchaeota archaeon]|nr:hypothetical protein [Candidatus Aenigmarchaeota archaeon]
MADSSAIGVIMQMITSLLGDIIGTIRTQSGLFKQLLSAMGGVFGAGGLSPYIGAVIVLAVAILLVRFLISESKVILALVGIVLFIFMLIVVF